MRHMVARPWKSSIPAVSRCCLFNFTKREAWPGSCLLSTGSDLGYRGCDRLIDLLLPWTSPIYKMLNEASLGLFLLIDTSPRTTMKCFHWFPCQGPRGSRSNGRPSMLESEAWFCGSPLIPFLVDVPLSDGCESVLSECSERRAHIYRKFTVLWASPKVQLSEGIDQMVAYDICDVIEKSSCIV